MSESNLYGFSSGENNPFFRPSQAGQQAAVDQAEAQLVTIGRVISTYWKSLVKNGMSEHAATALCIAMQDTWTTQK